MEKEGRGKLTTVLFSLALALSFSNVAFANEFNATANVTAVPILQAISITAIPSSQYSELPMGFKVLVYNVGNAQADATANITIYDSGDNEVMNFQSSETTIGVLETKNITKIESLPLMAGDYNVTAYVDYNGFTAGPVSTIITILVGEAPTVNIMSPDEGVFFNSSTSTIDFIFNVTDPDSPHFNCTLYVDSVETATNSSVNVDTDTTLTAPLPAEGPHSWNVTCVDRAGNVNSSDNRTLTVDTIVPAITFVLPTNDSETMINTNYAQVNATIDELHLDTFKLNWNGTDYGIYDDSLVLSMSFNNNSEIGENDTYVVDISRYGNNGTINGATWTAEGRFGSAFSFDGVDDSVSIPYDPNFNFGTGDFGISFWLKTTQAGQYPTLIARADDHEWGAYMRNGNIHFYTPTKGNVAFTSGAVNDGNWHHVAVTRIGTILTMYVDTASQYSNSGWSDDLSSVAALNLGYDGGNLGFNGTMDEVRIYKGKGLTQSEVLMHYQSEFQKYNNTQYRFYANVTGLIQGNHSFYAWANDTAGNYISSEVRNITVSLGPSCGGTITANTTLTEDLNCAGPGLVIGADDVTLDCAGHMINFSQSEGGEGIHVPGHNGTIIKNCYIAQDNSSLDNLRGIWLNHSNGSLVTNNTIYLPASESHVSIYVDGSSGNLIYNNRINASAYNSIFVSQPDPNSWNISLTESTNIMGGPYLGGNYYGKTDGSGVSDTCTDADFNGICDGYHEFEGSGNNRDEYPLTTYFAPCAMLDAENSVTTLDRDYDADQACFIIKANNVTLDCNGYTINYSQVKRGAGVYNNGYNLTIVRYCNFSNGVFGGNPIDFNGSFDSSILDNNFSMATQCYGVSMKSGGNNTISRNMINIFGPGSAGIYQEYEMGDTITNNDIFSPAPGMGAFDTLLTGVSGMNFSSNRIVHGAMGGFGMMSMGSSNNSYSDSNFTMTGDIVMSMMLMESNSNFTNIRIEANGSNDMGIMPNAMDNVRFTGCFINVTGGAIQGSGSNSVFDSNSIMGLSGISFSGSNNNFLSNNITATGASGSPGITLTSTSNNNLTDNIIIAADLGVSLQSSSYSNLFEGGTITVSGGEGILIDYGSIDFQYGSDYSSYDNSFRDIVITSTGPEIRSESYRSNNTFVNITLNSTENPTSVDLDYQGKFAFSSTAAPPDNGLRNISRYLDITPLKQWSRINASELGSGYGLEQSSAVIYSGNLVIGSPYSGSIPYLAQWNGTNWSSLGSGVNGAATGLAIYNGELIVGGDFTTAGGSPANHIAKWNGSEWSTMGSGLNAGAYAFTEYGGKLVVGGNFTAAGGNAANYIAKWDGSDWSSFSSEPDARVMSLAVYNGDLIAGGEFSNAGGVPAKLIANWNGSEWSSLGFTAQDAYAIYATKVYGGELYAGGWFQAYDPDPIKYKYIAKWNGMEWSTVEPFIDNMVEDMVIFEGKLVVAGTQFSVEGVSGANSIAQWNGSEWSALDPLGNNPLYALATDGQRMYVAGRNNDEYFVAEWIQNDSSAANISIQYDDTGLGFDESALRMYEWNGSVWSLVPDSAVDTNANIVYANISSFSIFAPMAPSGPSCGGTITENLTLTENMTCDGTAIIIGADNVTLDCNGSSITGDGTGSGIKTGDRQGDPRHPVITAGNNYTTVKNCIITNFSYGIDFDYGASYSTISNNTISLNGDSGIYLDSSSNNTLTNNTVSLNGINGIVLSGGYNNTLADNTVSSNDGVGIALDSSSDNIIANNNISSDPFYGILLNGDCYRNTIANNTISDNDDSGINIRYSYDNNLTGNNLSGSGLQDLFIISSTGTYLKDQPIDSYSLDSSGLIIENTSAGKLAFLNYSMTESGSNLSLDIVLRNNYTFVNSSLRPGFNTSAEITLNELNFTNATPTVDIDDSGAFVPCPSDRCTDIVYNASGNGELVFNVTGFTTYAAEEAPTGPAVTYLNGSNCSDTLSSSGTYILSDNMSCSGTALTIGANNITLDCAGFTINGTSSGNGIDNSVGYDYVSVKNCNITGFSTGIVFIWADYGTIDNNTVSSNNDTGIYISSGADNTVANNTVTNNSNFGILFDSDSNDTLANNSASSNYEGIAIYSSSNNNLTNNNMTNNSFNFGLYGTIDSHYDNNIDTSNTVDGKPVYYVKDANDITYDGSTDAGAFYCVSCNNITVKDLTLVKNEFGLLFWNTNNSIIQNMNITDNIVGVYLEYSSSNIISNNTARSNTQGITLEVSLNNNTIVNNTVIDSTDRGISLDWNANYNIIANNTVDSNLNGIWLDSGASNNTIANNTVRGNADSGIQLSNDGDISADDNIIYNNLFNNTNNTVSRNVINFWNTTLICDGPANIIGGPCVGGNVWAQPDGNGWSENSTECNANSSGLCASQYNITEDGNNIDYLPLTNLPSGPTCGGTITANTTLTDNMTCEGTAIIIGADDVTLDCNGFTINYSSSAVGYAVNVSGYNRTAVKNCNINQKNNLMLNSHAIFLNASSNSALQDNNMTFPGGRDDPGYGIYSIYSSGNNISRNRVSGIAQYGVRGIFIQSSYNDNISGNVFTNVDIAGQISGCNDSVFDNNAMAARWAAFDFTSSYRNNLTNNNFADSENYGVAFSSSSDNRLINNNFTTSNGNGAYFSSSNRNILIGNKITSNSRALYLYSSSNNTLTDNNITSNTGQGVYIYGAFDISNNNVFTNNNITSINNRILVFGQSSSYNNFTGNNFNGNEGLCLWGGSSSNYNRFVNNSVSAASFGASVGGSSQSFINNTISASSFGVSLAGTTGTELAGNNIASTNDIAIKLESSSSSNNIRDNVLKSGTVDFVSTGSSSNQIINLTFNSTSFPAAASFTYSGDINVTSASAQLDSGLRNVSKYLIVTNASSGAWVYLNISYGDSALDETNQSKLRMYRWNGSAWQSVTNSTVDTANNIVYANITQFSTFAPMANLSQIYSCENLTTENATYTLMQSVNSSGTCFNVRAKNVTLDCDGKMINYSKTQPGYGVSVSGYNFTTVKNCNIIKGGSAPDSSYGIYFASNLNNTLMGNNITTSGSGGNSYGIYLASSSNNNLTSNYVNTSSSSGNFAYGIYLSGSLNNTLMNNNIATSGSGSYAYGIYVGPSSNNNIVMNNKVNTSGSGTEKHGIYLYFAIYNNITSNNITTSGTYAYGIYLQSSQVNNVTGNMINTTNYGAAGLVFCGGSNNILMNNIINTRNSDARGIALYLCTVGSNNNTFTSNNITTTSSGANGIYLLSGSNNTFANNILRTNASTSADFVSISPSSNNTIINMTFNSTSFPTTASFTYNGSINVTSSAGQSNAGLVNVSKYLNATNSTAAWVFLNISYGDSALDETNQSKLRMYRWNGSAWQSVTNSMVDTANNIVYANITQFSTFAPLVDPTAVYNCQDLASADTIYTLKNNVSSDGTCFNVVASNVTLDCNGYTINYSSSVSGYGINVTGYDRATVKNCNIKQTGTTGSSHAVFIRSSSNNTVSDNNLTIKGSDVAGIYFYYDSDHNNLTSNVITSSGGYGIDLSQNSDNNAVSSNIVSSYSTGVSLSTGSHYNNFTSNNITSFAPAFSSRGGDHNRLTYNNITSTNNNGVYLDPGNYNTFIGNNITSSGGSQTVYVSSGSKNVFESNVISGETEGVYLYADSTYNNITSNIISTSGYGAHLLFRSKYNSFTSNNLTSTNNIGVYLQSDSSYNNFTLNNLTSSNNNAIRLDNSAGNNFSSNKVTSTTGGAIRFYVNSNGSRFEHNTITAKDFGVYFESDGGSHNSFVSNNISSTFTGVGIYLGSGTTDNNFSYNRVTTNYLGVYFAGSSSNNVSNNVITSNGNWYAVYLAYSANNNIVSYNSISSMKHGVYIINGPSGNDFSHNNITSSSNYALLLETNANNNRFYSDTITSTGSNGIKILDSSGNNLTNDTVRSAGTDFTSMGGSNNMIANMTFNFTSFPTAASFTYSGNVTLDSSSGQQGFGLINVSKYLDITNTTSAWVSLNLSYSDSALDETNQSKLRMYRWNGSEWLLVPSSAVDTTNNLVYANISQFSTFAPMVDANALYSCQDLNESDTVYSLKNNVSNESTCFNIIANNVTLECNGYTINYSTSAVGYGVNVTNYNFTMIKNCKIVQINTALNNAYGISLSGASNGTYSGNNVSVRGTSYGTALSLSGSSNNTFAYNNFTGLAGSTAGGIGAQISSNSNSNNFTGNTFDSIRYGVYLDASTLNTFTSNAINSRNVYATYLKTSSNSNKFIDNNITSTSNALIIESSSRDNNFTQNRISGESSSYVVWVYNSNNNTFDSNNFSMYGTFRIESSNDCTITGGKISSGKIDFTSVGSSGTTISNVNFSASSYPTVVSLTYGGSITVDSADAQLGAGLRNVSRYINVTNTTAAWVYLNISYSDSALDETNQSKLSMYRWNGSVWNKVVNGTVNTIDNMVYANLSQFSVFAPMADLEGPSAIYHSKRPTDIDTFSVLGTPLNITYNITDQYSGVNNESPILHYKTNSSSSDVWAFVNGSIYLTGYQTKSSTSNVSELWKFRLFDNQVYPATYNFDEYAMEQTSHSNYTLSGDGQYVRIELLNVSSSKAYSIFEVMVYNNTDTAAGLRVYYCNSSYSTGDPITSENCYNFYTLAATPGFNHTHSQYSSHQVIPFSMNATTGMIDTVYVTPTSYFLLRGPASGSWNVSYIENVSRADAANVSADDGGSWSAISGTFDSHLHQYDGTDTFYYYACANDTLNNSNCSILLSDTIRLGGVPPIAPSVYAPAEGFHGGSNLSINYTAAFSPNGYAITHYNISLVDENETFVSTIQGNNSLNLSFGWNSAASADGRYHVRVIACDNNSLCSLGYSEPFTLDNTIPAVNITAPLNDSILHNRTITINFTATDTNLDYTNISVYNSTADLIASTTNSTNGDVTVNLTVTDDGVYSINATVYDLAGNINSSEVSNIIVSLNPVCGETITRNFTLTGNMSCAGTAVIIGANDVTLDCNGFTINYSQTMDGYGVNISGNYATVRNCNITEGNYGGYGLAVASYGNMINNTITSFGNHGVYSPYKSYNNFTGNTISGGGRAFWLIGGSYNILANNTIIGLGAYALTMESGSSLNSFVGNNITSPSYGVTISSGSYNNFTNNNISSTGGNNAYVVSLESSSHNNSFRGNRLSSFGQNMREVYLSSSGDNNFTNNTLLGENRDNLAIYAYSSSGNRLSNNSITVNGRASYCIYMDSSSRNNVTENVLSVINYNGYGISVSSSSTYNSVYGNNITTSNGASHAFQVTSSDNNVISSNTIITTGADSMGIVCSSSSGTNLTWNRINVSGGGGSDAVFLNTCSNSNISFNNINKRGAGFSPYGGIRIAYSSSNIFADNNFTSSGGSPAVLLSTASSRDNNFTGNRLSSNYSYLTVAASTSGNTFTDTTFADINGNGSVRYQILISLPSDYVDLSAASLNISWNDTMASPTIYLNTSNSTINGLFNISAHLTMHGLPFVNGTPIVDVDDTGFFTSCELMPGRCGNVSFNDTTDTLEFDVIGFTTYAAEERPEIIEVSISPPAIDFGDLIPSRRTTANSSLNITVTWRTNVPVNFSFSGLDFESGANRIGIGNLTLLVNLTKPDVSYFTDANRINVADTPCTASAYSLGESCFSVAESTELHLWHNLNVPANQPAGIYNSTIVIKTRPA